jgi:hypothetical protein
MQRTRALRILSGLLKALTNELAVAAVQLPTTRQLDAEPTSIAETSRLRTRLSHELTSDTSSGTTHLTSIVYGYYHLTELSELETLSLSGSSPTKMILSTTLLQEKSLNRR